MENQKKKITISAVIDCLNEGMKREDVAEHFGLTMSETKKLFEHPKLKGKQARKPVTFELVDDTEEEESTSGSITALASEEVQEEEMQGEAQEELEDPQWDMDSSERSIYKTIS